MPILCAQIDPYSLDARPAAWAYCAIPKIEFDGKTGTLVYPVYASKQAAYTGGKPIRVVEIPLGREAVYGPPPLISEYVPPEWGYKDGNTDEPVLIREEQLPVYGPAPVIRQATPSLQDLIDAHPEVFAALTAIVDSVALSQPEFAGGEVDE